MSEAIEAELVLVALGARARIELAESAGIEAENGAIVVDGCGGTSNPRIWAVGDAVISTSVVMGVRRPVQLVGAASRVGRESWMQLSSSSGLLHLNLVRLPIRSEQRSFASADWVLR